MSAPVSTTLSARIRTALVAGTATASSAQRTYRYLRIGTAATVAVIFTAAAVSTASVGVLPSLSAYYHSPARDAFVGALVAAALALFALSGRGPSRALLDAAALLAPLIALVPTPAPPGIPPAAGPDLGTSIATYLIVGFAIVAVAAGLTVARQTDPVAAVGSLGVAVIVLTAVGVWHSVAPIAFAAGAHAAATVAFFALIAAVAVLAALSPADPAAPWLRVAYFVIAGLLVLTGVAFAAVSGAGIAAPIPPVLACEVAALTLFLVFWALQTVQHWRDPDPALRA